MIIKDNKLLKVSSVVLIVLLAVLGALFFCDNEQMVNESLNTVQISNINVKDIAAVAIANQKASFGFMVGKEGILLESSKKDDEYSQEEMQAFIYTMSKLVSNRAIKDYGEISAYGLDNPKSKITIIKRDGIKIRYFLGDKSPVDGSFYLLKEGDDRIFLVDKITGELMLREENDFLKKDLLPGIEAENINLLETISIYSKKKPERAYTITNLGDYTFRLKKPINNSISTDQIFSNIILPLSAMYPDKLIDSVNLSDFGLDKPDYIVDVKYNRDDYRILISKGKEGKYYITVSGKKRIYEIPPDQIAFLEIDYLDMLAHSIYNCNISKIKSITLSDRETDKDYNIEVTGKTTDIKGIINGKTIEYVKFMEFFKYLNSIKMANEVQSINTNAKPYFTVTINKKNGNIDIIEFIKKNDSESYVKVNNITNFTVFNKSVKEILMVIQKLIS